MVDTSADFDKWLLDFEKNNKEPEASQTRKVRFLANNVHSLLGFTP